MNNADQLFSWGIIRILKSSLREQTSTNLIDRKEKKTKQLRQTLMMS